MILEIVVWPDPILKQKCEPVPVVTEAVRWLLTEMEETMHNAKGVGLSAPQVGRPLRAIVVRNPATGLAIPIVNPVIVERSPEKTRVREGCLSLPGYFEMVERHVWVRAEGMGALGEPVNLWGDGLLGQALQHEVEHLDGIVFVDHLSVLKRSMALKKVRKELLRELAQEEYEEEVNAAPD